MTANLGVSTDTLPAAEATPLRASKQALAGGRVRWPNRLSTSGAMTVRVRMVPGLEHDGHLAGSGPDRYRAARARRTQRGPRRGRRGRLEAWLTTSGEVSQ